jgi:hypothetical protein
VGISRYAEITAYGSYTLYQGACTACSGNSIAAGLGLTYHLVQASAMDPWARFSMGYRTSDFEFPADASEARELAPGRYHGIDIARFTMGASFAPVAGFSVGPSIMIGVGTFVSGPEELRPTRAYGLFQLGLTLELDPVMWTEETPASGATASAVRLGPISQ